jgi:heme/copper-type cytochrome/quinol oxidase subunit 2
MRLVILAMCAVLAAGVLAMVCLAIWSTRRASATETVVRQASAAELVWAAIPYLLALAAAIPAVVATVSTLT